MDDLIFSTIILYCNDFFSKMTIFLQDFFCVTEVTRSSETGLTNPLRLHTQDLEIFLNGSLVFCDIHTRLQLHFQVECLGFC